MPSGDAFGFNYNGEEYYYIKNVQNDIVAIADKNGTVVANYYYDAWGNVTQIPGNTALAQTNPLRYRSYYYDSETGYYHLKSRYYNPELCRFINADSVDVLDEDQNNVLENNLFAYCLNNPVNMVDDGKMSNAIRSTATLGILTTGLLFGWQVSAAIIIAIAVIAVVQILVVYAKSKRRTGRPELKKQVREGLEKRNKNEQVGKKVR